MRRASKKHISYFVQVSIIAFYQLYSNFLYCFYVL